MWRFNLLLLRLLGEISLSLLCLHRSRGSALDLDQPLPVGCLRTSVLRSDRMGLKGQLLRGLWLTQARGREGYGVPGEPAVAEAGVTLQQSEACCVFSQGSCLWITGPWQWRAAQAPGRGGVESDLCMHTGFLVAAAAALASHSCLWGPRWYPQLMPFSGAPLRGTLNPLSFAPGNKEARKSLLPFQQLQTFSWTPSRPAVAH